AVYFFFLTGGRLGHYRPTLVDADLQTFPLPDQMLSTRELATFLTDYALIDKKTCDLYHLKESERVLIQDFMDFVLPDFKGDPGGAGAKSAVSMRPGATRSILFEYCE